MSVKSLKIEYVLRYFAEYFNTYKYSDDKNSELKEWIDEAAPILLAYIKKEIAFQFSKPFGSAEIDDLASDFFLKIIENSGKFHSDIQYPKAFYAKCIYRHCISGKRKRDNESRKIEPKSGESCSGNYIRGEDGSPVPIVPLSESEQELHAVRICIRENVISDLGELCMELLHGSFSGLSVAEMKKRSKVPKSIHHENLQHCRELLGELVKKSGLIDADPQVFDKFFVEELKKFLNPKPMKR